MADICMKCGEVFSDAATVINKKGPEGLSIRVVNVPGTSCKCKNEQESRFSFYDAMIIEDYIKNMKEPRNIIDFKEVQDAYKGLTVEDIMGKEKKKHN